MDNMSWSEILEKIYLAFSRIFDGIIKLFAGEFGKEEE